MRQTSYRLREFRARYCLEILATAFVCGFLQQRDVFYEADGVGRDVLLAAQIGLDIGLEQVFRHIVEARAVSAGPASRADGLGIARQRGNPVVGIHIAGGLTVRKHDDVIFLAFEADGLVVGGEISRVARAGHAEHRAHIAIHDTAAGVVLAGFV